MKNGDDDGGVRFESLCHLVLDKKTESVFKCALPSIKRRLITISMAEKEEDMGVLQVNEVVVNGLNSVYGRHEFIISNLMTW